MLSFLLAFLSGSTVPNAVYNYGLHYLKRQHFDGHTDNIHELNIDCTLPTLPIVLLIPYDIHFLDNVICMHPVRPV